jgi:hypothetical protein
MNPINFENAQWHIQSTREVVEVRRIQQVPELWRIYVRGYAVTGDLPPHDQRVLIARMIEAVVPGALSDVASQAFQLCGQIVQQQQQAAAAKIQPANEAAEAVVAEAAAALGGGNG